MHFLLLLSKLIGTSFPINVLTVFLFHWSSHHRKKNRVAYFVIKTVLYAVWHFRNKSTFQDGSEDHRATFKYALQDLKGRIKLDFFRLIRTCFQDFWCIPYLLSVENEKIIFKFS